MLLAIEEPCLGYQQKPDEHGCIVVMNATGSWIRQGTVIAVQDESNVTEGETEATPEPTISITSETIKETSSPNLMTTTARISKPRVQGDNDNNTNDNDVTEGTTEPRKQVTSETTKETSSINDVVTSTLKSKPPIDKDVTEIPQLPLPPLHECIKRGHRCRV